MADKQAVGLIYAELQGYLAQAPKDGYTDEEKVWCDVNHLVQKLDALTRKKNYAKFYLEPITSSSGKPYLYYNTYRLKLGGLVALLHREYFLDEPTPFASMPPMIVHQSQYQNQSVEIQLQQEVKNLIELKLSKAKGKEKTFWEKIKGGLSTVKNVSQLVSLITTTAEAAGIPIEQLASLFS